MSRAPHRRRSRPARAGAALLAIGLALLAAAVTGCSTPAVGRHTFTLKLCGVTFWRSPEGIFTTPLNTATQGMPPAPARSRLPAMTNPDAGGPPRVVSVSSDCSHGRTVVVSPVSSVRVCKVAKDGAGRIVAFSLARANPRTPVRVHVYAYDGTRPTGQIFTTVF